MFNEDEIVAIIYLVFKQVRDDLRLTNPKIRLRAERWLNSNDPYLRLYLKFLGKDIADIKRLVGYDQRNGLQATGGRSSTGSIQA
jgi:hypothetical protein